MNLTDDNDIVPTWLYIKQHIITRLKYFGKTTAVDPYKYPGSGKYWKRHLKKNGNHVETIWAHRFTGRDDITRFAMLFSKLNNIAESKEWANLIPENGIDGNCKGNIPWNIGKTGYFSPKALNKMSQTHTGRIPWVKLNGQTRETRTKISIANKGKQFRLGAKLSEETKKLLSTKAQERKKISCEFCSKQINPSSFYQFHGNKCKQNPNRVVDLERLEQTRLRQSFSAKNRKSVNKKRSNYEKV